MASCAAFCDAGQFNADLSKLTCPTSQLQYSKFFLSCLRCCRIADSASYIMWRFCSQSSIAVASRHSILSGYPNFNADCEVRGIRQRNHNTVSSLSCLPLLRMYSASYIIVAFLFPHLAPHGFLYQRLIMPPIQCGSQQVGRVQRHNMQRVSSF